MGVLEVWLLAATVANANPGAQPETKTEPPPVELLEFLGDWREEEARLIDDYRPREKPAGAEVQNNGKN